MAFTALDKTALLVVVDLQNGITSRPIERVDEVVSNAAALARAFGEQRLPVVLVQVVGMAPGRTG